ncbi:MAG: hypothetical protein HOP28_15720 [Gemmatimonadales bacterium]|nr:hypothetical protein [Gemmatimonadales bacterium]
MRKARTIAMLLALSAQSATAQMPDSLVTQGVKALSEFARICALPSSAVWRVSLCGPMVLVDPESRGAIANRRPPTGEFAERDGMYVGTLPAEMWIANTAIDWRDERWTMVMLPLPDEPFDRRRLLAHEAFHRIQPALGVSAANAVVTQLEERDARYWLRLELRALSAVQLDSGDARARTALSDALLFGEIRHRQFAGTDTLEAILELSEGLAEYTGILVAARIDSVPPYVAVESARRSFEARSTYVRSYGYGAGPALGLALDRFAPGWRGRAGTIRSLSLELARAVNWTPPTLMLDSGRARAALYDAAVIAAEEDRRATARAARLAAYRSALIDGPRVIFQQRGLGGAFNPNTIVPLGAEGLVYPRRTVSAEWGELTVHSGGLLVASDLGSAYVTAAGITIDDAAHKATGQGWELKMAAGWTIRPGTRPGDYEVVRRPPPLPTRPAREALQKSSRGP